MVPIRGGITVKPHVQRFADDISAALGVSNFGTYVGHSPPEGPTQAVDIFTPDNATGYILQDKICEWIIAHQKKYGIRYCIRRHHIWNIERADEGWRDQGVAGDRTADHYDHVHVTFYASAEVVPEPELPTDKDTDMFTYSTAKDVDSGSIWLVTSGVAFRMHRPEDVERLNKAGVLSVGEMSESFHNVFEHRG